MGQDAILTDQRNDIGDGSQRGQGGGFDEKFPKGFADASRAGNGVADSPGQLERDAGAAEIRIGIRRADSRQAGMDDGMAIRKPRRIAVRLMMVGNDQVDIALPGDRRRLDRRDAAIDRHDQLGAVIDNLPQRLGVEAVSFVDAMRNVGVHLTAEERDGMPEDAGGGDAVNVVIAVNDDFLAVADGPGDPCRRGGQARQQRRIGQRQKAWPQKRLGVVEATRFRD